MVETLRKREVEMLDWNSKRVRNGTREWKRVGRR